MLCFTIIKLSWAKGTHSYDFNENNRTINGIQVEGKNRNKTKKNNRITLQFWAVLSNKP